MGELIFSIAYGGFLIILGLFSKYMIARMTLKKKDENTNKHKEVM
ncbi:hypothetical protein QGM71_20725 [Virgibacillus sp. C22-A2]|uniref:Uncharacterized protein n=1 Tax=Virgibacillus tibetensis TaxID=3042313 RepID=A0ABU6KMT1_9BACI|nr:hypothetical protein [Virgibacillus sp. C22-A2]